MQVDIRPMVENDRAFLANSWLQNFKRESDWSRHLDVEMYFRSHRHLVHKLLATSDVWVACDPEDPTLILGFIVGYDSPEAAVIHYLYVREKFRRVGIGRQLFATLTRGQAKPVVGTHWTASSRSIARETHPAVYNPYLLMDMT